MTIHNNLYGEESLFDRTDALVHMADLALAFGRIDRTGPCHPDGTPESDSDHTVMLGWVAPSLADLINDRMGFAHYDVHRIASYALVHDAVEVYAGDTCTIRVTEDDLAAKEERESLAGLRLRNEFNARLPWFAKMVDSYESQADREARFVRAVDKVLPKMVHLVDKRIGLRQQGVTRAEFISLIARQRQMVSDNVAGGSYLILSLYDILCAKVLQGWDDEDTSPGPPQPRHWADTSPIDGVRLHHENCDHEDTEMTCPFTVAWRMCSEHRVPWPSQMFNGPLGKYELALDERGLLTVKGN